MRPHEEAADWAARPLGRAALPEVRPQPVRARDAHALRRVRSASQDAQRRATLPSQVRKRSRGLKGWLLVAKWSWRHGEWLDHGTRMVARSDPRTWVRPSSAEAYRNQLRVVVSAVLVLIIIALGFFG